MAKKGSKSKTGATKDDDEEELDDAKKTDASSIIPPSIKKDDEEIASDKEDDDEGFLTEEVEKELASKIASGDLDLEKLSVKDIPGIGASIIKKLTESGFTSVRAIATMAPKILQEESGVGDKTAQKVVAAAQELCKIGFQTADVIFEKRKNLGRIATGSNSLNEILGGGIETGAITELYGEFRTGKTQIAHQACINVQLPVDQGGLSGKAIYIDTEGTFRPERLASMAAGKGLDVPTALKNVIYARAYNSEHQINILKQCRKLIEKENVKLIVIDSIIGHFRAEYIGLGTLGPRQQALNHHIHALQQLCDTYNVAAIVTNQVQAKPDVFFGNPTIAAGGNIMGHASTYRIYLRKGKGETRVAKMVDAPGLPEAEAVFKITEKGIEDADE